MRRYLERGAAQAPALWRHLSAGNGLIYQPLTQPVVDLGIDDFMAGPGEEAIQVSRSAWNGVYNVCPGSV